MPLMTVPEFRFSKPVAVLIIIVSILLAPVLVFFAVANLLHPDVPDAYLTQNTFVCLAFCGLGVALVFVAISTYRGSIRTPRDS